MGLFRGVLVGCLFGFVLVCFGLIWMFVCLFVVFFLCFFGGVFHLWVSCLSFFDDV